MFAGFRHCLGIVLAPVFVVSPGFGVLLRRFCQWSVAIFVIFTAFSVVFVGFRHCLGIVLAPVFAFFPGFGPFLRRRCLTMGDLGFRYFLLRFPRVSYVFAIPELSHFAS